MKLKYLARVIANLFAGFPAASQGGVMRFDSDGGTPQSAPLKSMSPGVIDLTAATLTMTEIDHAGRTILSNLAATQTITLPRATGSGAMYRFYVKILKTGDLIIKVANADDSMLGSIHMLQDGGDTSIGFEIAAADDTITLNGSTKGGLAGDRVDICDVLPGLFMVHAWLSGSGSEATPMSAAVS